jgi:hypothetical protein
VSEPRLSRPARARLGYILGVVVAACGLAVQLGYGWGLVLAGAGLSALFVWLYPVEGPDVADDGPDDGEVPW